MRFVALQFPATSLLVLSVKANESKLQLHQPMGCQCEAERKHVCNSQHEAKPTFKYSRTLLETKLV